MKELIEFIEQLEIPECNTELDSKCAYCSLSESDFRHRAAGKDDDARDYLENHAHDCSYRRLKELAKELYAKRFDD